MSNLGSFKPSIHLEELLTEELREDSQNFVQFLTAYYEWLQTTSITYESRNGSFAKNEIIVGTSTLAQATINQVDSTNNQLIVTMTTNKQFDNQEVFAQSIPEVRFNVVAGSNTITYSSSYSNTVLAALNTEDEIRINGENHIIDSINTNAIVIENAHTTGATSAHLVKLGPYVSIINVVDTSTIRATISDLSDNVIRKSGKLLDYRDPEKTIDKYVDFLKQELYNTFPKNPAANERQLARRLREFYKAKGNDESYRFLFKVLFNEEIELKYPGEDLLRISDGKFEKTNTLRVQDTSNIFEFLNKTVVGANSGALGTVVDIRKIIVAETEIAQMELGLVVGTFDAGEEIYDVNDTELSANLYGIVSGFTINDGGSGYEEGDNIVISGDGSGASARVSSIRRSPVYKLKINDIGYGYREGVVATINNTGTSGEGLEVGIGEIANTYVIEEPAGVYHEVGSISKIFILDRGAGYAKKPIITLIDPVIEPLGMLSDRLITINSGGSGYAVGDALTFTGGTAPTTTAVGQVASVTGSNNITFEDESSILFDNGLDRVFLGFRTLYQTYPITFNTLSGPITRWIRFYRRVPIYYDKERDKLKDENTPPTGSIVRIELTNYGKGYDYLNLPTVGVTSSGGAGASFTITNIQGRSANVEVDTANVEAKYGIGSIREIEILDYGLNYSNAAADMTGSGDGNANLTALVTGSGTSKGFWINDDGKVDYKYIQDSEYWQDFSYVIRCGLVFERYANIVKEILHPAGTVFFGEILIYNEISVTPTFTGMVDVIGAIQNYFIYIRSLADVHIDSDPQKIEKEIPLEALDPAPLTNDNNIDPVVIIEKPIDLTGDEHTEYIVNIERPIDIHIDSDPQKIEKEIPLEALDPPPLTDTSGVDPVVVIQKIMDVTGDENTEYEIDLEVDIDVTGYEHTEYKVILFPEALDPPPLTDTSGVDPVVVIQKIMDIHIDSDPQKIEKEYELPIDVHITSNKEYEVILERNVDVSTANDKEYIIKFPIEGFAGNLAPHSQKIEKEYELPIDVHITSNKEYEVILERDVDVSSTNDKEYIIKFPIEGFAGNLAPHSQKVEKEYELPIDVHITSNKEYLIYYQTEANTSIDSDPQKIEKEIPLEALDPAPLTNDTNIDPVVIIEKPIDLTGDEHTEYIIQPGLDGANAAVGAPAGPITSTYGEQQITAFAFTAISSLQDITFDTEYLTTVDIFTRASGTVNVSSNIVFGTGTTFLSDFIEDIPIIIDNAEKFVVKSIANNEYMELNVPSQSSYTDVYAYR